MSNKIRKIYLVFERFVADACPEEQIPSTSTSEIMMAMIPVLNAFYCLALGTSLLSVNSFLDCKSEIYTYF